MSGSQIDTKTEETTRNEVQLEQSSEAKPTESQVYTTDFRLIPIPGRLRHTIEKPFHFSLGLNAAFGFASTFIVANLYYCQPLLIELSKSFNVTYSEVSRIPTLVQAGYATGLLLLSPLGDLVRRRQLILGLVFCSGSLTIGLSVTSSLTAFEVLSYLVGTVSVTPQILLPLAADLAPIERRASATSVVLSGLLFGILLARVLAGIIAEYTSWRVVYYFSIGVQSLVLVGSYLLIPDYPAKNVGLSYWNILYTMGKYAVTEPILIQSVFVNIASSATFSSLWVTLTLLLGGPPYYYSTLVIGLFGLVGMVGVATGPLVGRTIDRLVPWYASLIATLGYTCFQCINVGAAGINIAAVIIACFGLDVCRQMQQVSLSTSVFSISTAARARLNAVFVLSLFIGQVMGTSVGTKVFVQYGWRASAGVSLAWMGFQILALLFRGPHCDRYTWFGYQGGMEARKSVVEERGRRKAAKEDLEKGVDASQSNLPKESSKDTEVLQTESCQSA